MASQPLKLLQPSRPVEPSRAMTTPLVQRRSGSARSPLHRHWCVRQRSGTPGNGSPRSRSFPLSPPCPVPVLPRCRCCPPSSPMQPASTDTTPSSRAELTDPRSGWARGVGLGTDRPVAAVPTRSRRATTMDRSQRRPAAAWWRSAVGVIRSQLEVRGNTAVAALT